MVGLRGISLRAITICPLCAVLLAHPPVRAQELEPAVSQSVEVNGIQMYYETFGSGEPLVLLHGFASTGRDAWGRVIKEFASHYRVILPDLRGHGRSTNPSEVFTHRQSARDIYALLDHCGIQQFRAMGISSGGMTLLHMATQQPERVQAMVLIGATHYFPEQARKLMREVTEDIHERRPNWWGFQAMAQRHAHGEPQFRMLRRQFHAFKDSYDDMNFTRPFLSTINARTLIVHGDRDEFFPVEIPVEMYTSIPHSALWIIPGGGHVPIFGENVPFVATVSRFLAQTPPASR